MNAAPTTETRVWDPYIRVSHWPHAAAVLVNWYTDEPRWMHVWLGYLAAALAVLRVLWGFFGPEYARFTSFVTGPRETLNYLFALLLFSSKRYLVTVAAKVERPARVPGQRRPPLLGKQVHETAANITLVLVVLHLCGVARASVAHKENLVRAMITRGKGPRS